MKVQRDNGSPYFIGRYGSKVVPLIRKIKVNEAIQIKVNEAIQDIMRSIQFGRNLKKMSMMNKASCQPIIELSKINLDSYLCPFPSDPLIK